MRPFSSVTKQITILSKRKMNFKSIPKAKAVLEHTNYYNIINGFKEFIVDPTKTPEEYYPTVYFEEVYALHEFDKRIRNLFLKYILLIEDTFRRHVAHEFARFEGSDKWNDPNSFDITTPQKNNYVSKLITKLNEIQTIINQDSKYDMINHFCSSGEDVPIWSLVNMFEFGTLKYFYMNMKLAEKDKIANDYYRLSITQLKSFLETINMFRNVCAHDFRISFYRIHDNDKRITDMPLHSHMNIRKNSSNKFLRGKSDLFSVVIIFRYMLSDEEFNMFFDNLKSAFRVLKDIWYLFN